MPYLQNTTHEGFIFNEATKAQFLGNGVHAAMAMRYFVANLPTGQLDANNQPIYANYNIGQAVGLYSSNGTGANLTEIYLDPVKLAITATETNLSNVTVWSANSILTQGRGDARYQNATNNTYANLTGKPTFANVATSGLYSDLSGTPNLSVYYLASNPSGYITASCLTYSNITGTPNLSLYLTTANAASTYLPSANFSFSNLTGKPTTLSGYGITDGLTSATAASTYQTISGMSSYLTISSAASTYLPSANFTYANITGKPTLATVATSGNYNDLSNKPASYTLPAATNSTLGGIIVGANLSVSANGTLSANIPAGGGGGFANGDILNGGTF